MPGSRHGGWISNPDDAVFEIEPRLAAEDAEARFKGRECGWWIVSWSGDGENGCHELTQGRRSADFCFSYEIRTGFERGSEGALLERSLRSWATGVLRICTWGCKKRARDERGNCYESEE